MSFRIEEDVALADVAIQIQADTLEAVLRESTEALLSVQLENPNAVGSEVVRKVELTAAAPDLLLYKFLQELIYLKDAHKLLLRIKKLTLAERNDGFSVSATLMGETFDLQRHHQSVDVKAATFHGLQVKESHLGWQATFILDI